MASEPIMSQPGSRNALPVPTSPMQAPLMPDGGSPSGGRGPRDRDGPMGYPPQQGGYGGGPNYPPQGSYPPQSHYSGPYGPPGSAYPPPPNQPYGYGPPMHPYPYPGYGPPQSSYGYGSGGGYPTQQGRGNEESKARPENQDTKKKKSPSHSRPESKSTSPPKSSPSLAEKKPETATASTKPEKDLDSAELKQSSSTESTLVEVDPMRTDFHFFVQDVREKIQQEAEAEVRRTMDNNLDMELLYTNLNSRLMKEWEVARQDLRDQYMQKEEEDRRRFMSDEEIASRHCATLTARAKSPRSSSEKADAKAAKEEEGESVNTDERETRNGGAKPAKVDTNAETNEAKDESKKRASPTGEKDGSHQDGSPSKKRRDDASDEKEETKKEEGKSEEPTKDEPEAKKEI